jgi:hypothetical protein
MPARPAAADTARSRRRLAVVFGPATSVRTIGSSYQCPDILSEQPTATRVVIADAVLGLGAPSFTGEDARGG